MSLQIDVRISHFYLDIKTGYVPGRSSSGGGSFLRAD
jgi:hypothetical protein